jgi:glycosyltransferase involved in cell wall biosynthesis
MGVLHRYFIKQLIGAAAIVILKEKYMRGVLEENGLLQEEKTCEIHNAVDLPNCAPKALSEAIVPRLLFLNMFKPWRRAEFILEVARRLRTIRNQFHIDIVGDKAAYGILVEETNRLRSRISAYGLDANVSIHPFTSCPTTYYQRSHIFLLPADLVFCNYALLEAMSYGMVPYVSNVDHGYIQIITDDVSGYGLPLDADGWASKIHGVLSDPQKYAMLSANARNTVRQHFSARANYQYYAEALRRRGILHDIGAPEDSPEVGHSQQECSQ